MKTFFIIAALLALTSCTGYIYDKAYVEKVEDSDNSDYQYMVTITSNGNPVVYYTDYKFQVGDSLVSTDEVFDNHKSKEEQYKIVIDSLKLENKKMSDKVNELEAYNRLLLGILSPTIKSKKDE